MTVASELDESVKNTRSKKELHQASLPFAKEVKLKSWFYLISTILINISVLAVALLSESLIVRILASVLGGLCMVRGFVLYHDYLHGAILRKSKLAKAIFYTYGALLLTPPSAWRATHNYHHAHVGKTTEPSHGSFPIFTTEAWAQMSTLEKLQYRIVRNPLVLLFGYLTVFLLNLCIKPIFNNVAKHWDAFFVIALHITVVFTLYTFFGWAGAIYAYILPLSLAFALGSYLFYIQHNWEGVQYLPEQDWNYFDAAVDASSFLKLGPVMNWFTANIGYHHVHHLNSRIPFYRLPETMAALPELQSQSTITLSFRDIISSLRLKLWDEPSQQLVGFREVRPQTKD